MIPLAFHTGEDGTTFDLGVLLVDKGRTLAGRVVCSDSKAPASGTAIFLSHSNSEGAISVRLDEKQRFELRGIPDGPVRLELYSQEPSGRIGYHFSRKNRCLDPFQPDGLGGLVKGDINGLTILLVPGDPTGELHVPGDIDPTVLADFKDAEAGPITGVPPGEYPPK